MSDAEARDPIRVLHVDDDAGFRRLVADSLQRFVDGVVVESVDCPAAVLDRLDRQAAAERARTDAAAVDTAVGATDEGDETSVVGETETRGATEAYGTTETDGTRETEGETDGGHGEIDCLLSDYEMPSTDGLQFLAAVRRRRPRLPFLLYTSRGDPELVSDALAAGVSDHVQKSTGEAHYVKLGNRIRREVERHRAREAAAERLAALEAAREGICVLDADGRVKYANDAYLELYGYERSALLGRRWETLRPESEVELIARDVLPFVEEHGEWGGETVGRRADGETFQESTEISALPDGELVVTARPFERRGDEE